ncbi:response regulator transcription factor [Homoserinimonas sp. OAct 916]|uniref:response regulator n=1 Tax=Homoserinimonas sp. OAct 916 TaxID=2211450 RepID=UPI000DBE58B2|nr:response regulator transcription factor [Homoserinimonas sp. OAct 916]
MIRVLVADDHPLVRSGFRMILEAEEDIEVVFEAANGGEAVAGVRAHNPDVVLMDVRMPGHDGLAATRDLAQLGLADRVLVLTTFDVDDYVHQALTAGASGFLLKDVDPPELVRAVRVVARGDTLLSAAITRRLADRFADGPAPDARRTVFAVLTERELEIFSLIAGGLNNDETAERLFISVATVKTHITRIFAKLGLRDRPQAVILGYESGLVQPGRRRDAE